MDDLLPLSQDIDPSFFGEFILKILKMYAHDLHQMEHYGKSDIQISLKQVG